MLIKRLLLMASLLLPIGCGGGGGGTPTASNDLTAPTTIVLSADSQTSVVLAKETSSPLVAIGKFSAPIVDREITLEADKITFTTSDNTVVAIDSSSDGIVLLKALQPGSATITATWDTAPGTKSVYGALTVTVTNATLVNITLASSSGYDLPKGVSSTFKATGVFSDNSSQDISRLVSWVSTAPGVATVNQGVVKGVGLGSADITATALFAPMITKTATVNISAAIPESLVISPLTATIPLGVTQQYNARAHFSDGLDLDVTADVEWSSTSPEVATISNNAESNGLATPLVAGATSIVAVLGDIAADPALLTVTPPALLSISLAFSKTHAIVGDADPDVQITVTGLYSDGSEINLTEEAIFALDVPASIAVVSNAVGTKGLFTPYAKPLSGVVRVTAIVTGVPSASQDFPIM